MGTRRSITTKVTNSLHWSSNHRSYGQALGLTKVIAWFVANRTETFIWLLLLLLVPLCRYCVGKEFFDLCDQLCLCCWDWWHCLSTTTVYRFLVFTQLIFHLFFQKSCQPLASITAALDMVLLVLSRFASEDTLRPILKRIAWSLNLCVLGLRPSLPSPFSLSKRQEELTRSSPNLSSKYALCEIRGDWKWLVELFGLFRHYWKCGSICHMCNAARIPR